MQQSACGALWRLTSNDAYQGTLVAAEAHVRIIRAMDRHQDDAQVQESACIALSDLAAVSDANQATRVAAERIFREMDRHQDDAQVQVKACGALWMLANNDANQVTLVAAEAHVRIFRAMDRHQDNAEVQNSACIALSDLAAVDDANQVTPMEAEAHVRIFRALDRHQDDAKVQKSAFLALHNLALNDANQVTLVAAEAHVRIIRAMDRHQDNVEVQRLACCALVQLALNDANKMTLAQAATAQIVLTMRLHPAEAELMTWACHALSYLAAHADSKVLMTRAGADVALLDVVDRDGDQDDEDWGEAVQDADPMDLPLVPSARLALRRLAANADSRVDDSWPVVVDRLRLIRIELLDLSAWAQSAATRTAVVMTASRSLRRLQGAGRTELFAHIAVFAFGTELVPLDGWKTAGGGGRFLALRRLLPLAEEQVRALSVCQQ